MVPTTHKKFTVEEYHRLVDLGFFTENDKIELIRGEIIEMSPKRTPHSVCNSLLWRELYDSLGRDVVIRIQEPIIISSTSEPEPDIVIAKKKDDDYLSSHPVPEDIILIIEISDSTLNFDRKTKLSLYAEAGINNYWIFNLVNNNLEVYQTPLQSNVDCYNYRSKNIFLPDEIVSIPTFDNLSLNLSKVFPKMNFGFDKS